MHERIKALRKTLKLTQQEFADMLKIGRGTLANYEVGRNEPIDAVILSICREFNVNEGWLRTGDGEMFVQQAKNEVLEERLRKVITVGNDSFRERMITLLLDLTSEEWKAVEAYAYRLIGGRTERPSEDAGADPTLQAQLAAAQSRIAELEAAQQEDAKPEAASETWNGKTREQIHAELDQALDVEKERWTAEQAEAHSSSRDTMADAG